MMTSAVAPDQLEPYRGWRRWELTVDEASGEPRLKSPYRTQCIWTPQQAMVSDCQRCPSGEPGQNCSCGIYMLKASNEALLESGDIYGEVSAWGTIVEGPRGIRAGTAAPVSLIIPANLFRLRRQRRLAAQLSEVYCVPTAVVFHRPRPRQWLDRLRFGLSQAIAALSLARPSVVRDCARCRVVLQALITVLSFDPTLSLAEACQQASGEVRSRGLRRCLREAALSNPDSVADLYGPLFADLRLRNWLRLEYYLCRPLRRDRQLSSYLSDALMAVELFEQDMFNPVGFYRWWLPSIRLGIA